MKARSPGKLVLSGSYSVLWGAPAIVTAVDRFATADRDRAAIHVAEEVVAAVELGLVPAPCFVDAGPLRTDAGNGTTRKLGLGSSAAILLATMVAWNGEPRTGEERSSLFENALAAHRKAQGGGSGIDVAASTFGGTCRFVIAGSKPDVTPIALPSDLSIAVFAATTSAVTSGFVAKVRALAASRPSDFDPLMAAASQGARAAVEATAASELCAALAKQRDALATVGSLAGVPIVTEEVAVLARAASAEGAFFGPSGAGGGDVAFFASHRPPSSSFVAEARHAGYDLLDCRIGAEGAREIPR
ncbi:MAG: hypothetical protein HOW73_42685 [Polyangiaceae bacterium]|nr:hypothetical protein [Polyangiaceae bacterium]